MKILVRFRTLSKAMLLPILICVCIILIYYALVKPHKFWRERGIPHENPLPFFGNLASVVFQKQSVAEKFEDIYNKHLNRRYVGFYQFLTPTLILRDPDLIKQITVKEFDSFPEHVTFASSDADPLWSKTLFAMPGGEEWRDIRAVLSPAFTSSKLRGMFGFIRECAKQLTDHFLEQGGFIKLEIKDAFTKATNDIIASTAFGVTCNSLKDPNNEIFVMGRDAADITGIIKSLKFFVAAISPMLMNLFKIRFISAETTTFFRKIIRETVAVREQNGIIRPDMIHLMMEARKGRLSHDDEASDSGSAALPGSSLDKVEKHRKTEITDDVMTAQAVNFFLGGFDTTATAMSYTAYELAINPDVQKRLRREVEEALEMCNGQITYESLMGMKYLDMVVSEVLRKWPPFAVTDRTTIRNFTIEPTEAHEKPLVLNTNVVCQIPIYSLHRDPKYYPSPDKFDPERFSDENKHSIRPFTYVPFGSGPRNCIGSRFALLEVKTVIFHLLCDFEIVPIEKTPIPIVLSKANVNPVPDEGFWLGLKPRNKTV